MTRRECHLGPRFVDEVDMVGSLACESQADHKSSSSDRWLWLITMSAAGGQGALLAHLASQSSQSSLLRPRAQPKDLLLRYTLDTCQIERL